MKKIVLLNSILLCSLTFTLGSCTSSKDTIANEPVATPGELIEKIHDYCNYSVRLEYYISRSTESVTYAEFSSDDFDTTSNALVDSLAITSAYSIDLYYTVDTLAVDIYQYDSYGTAYYSGTDVFINNEDGTCWQYVYPYNNSWGYRKQNGQWSDYSNSLLYAYDYGVQDGFNYYTYGVVDGKDCDAYTLEESLASYLFYSIGTDFLFNDVSSALSSFGHDLTYFFYESQEMLVNFCNRGYIYSGSLTDDTLIYASDYEIYATIYDVYDTSDKYAYGIHEDIQSRLS